MAYIKEAEGFLAKLPSISLEGMEPLAPQSAPKEQVLTVENQGYKVPLAATCTLSVGKAHLYMQNLFYQSRRVFV